MKNQTQPIKKVRHTRICISSSEKLTFWRTPQAAENFALECPHCGEKVFWLEREEKPDVEFYEEVVDKK